MSLRIGMWSGPRNISTAMMRAFENRTDTEVIDEPFYACYLHTTGIVHPMNDAVIASQSTDWATVAAQLCRDRDGIEIVYQKQMTHHMLRQVDLGWTVELRNCFLIRDPYYVVSSYARKRDTVNQDDIGILRQYELYQEMSDVTGQDIPVLDAGRFLRDPEAGLRGLCQRLEIPFSERMLSWPRGRRTSDGVWAAHWYEVVEQSTGFQAPAPAQLALTAEQQSIADEANEYYQRMLVHALP